MNRINTCFETLAASGKKALIPFITAGDPSPEVTLSLMHAMVEAGANIIELGVPFSDPMADGPVIQLASERALAAGTTTQVVLDTVAKFRETDNTTPVVLMGYLNPVEAMGYETFAHNASVAGVDGVLLVDLPPEEAKEVAPLFKEKGIELIFLLAPTTTPERVSLIAQAGSGYLYYVSLKGVTGSATLDTEAVAKQVAMIRERTSLPIGVGFGISDAASAKAIAKVADGVVVGSALVRRVAENLEQPEQIPTQVAALLADMRAAMDEGS